MSSRRDNAWVIYVLFLAGVGIIGGGFPQAMINAHLHESYWPWLIATWLGGAMIVVAFLLVPWATKQRDGGRK